MIKEFELLQQDVLTLAQALYVILDKMLIEEPELQKLAYQIEDITIKLEKDLYGDE